MTCSCPIQNWKRLHIVWQFNGEFGLCNYRCEYCYYESGSLSRHNLKHSIEAWRDAFKRCFPGKSLVLYLSFGEPTIGKCFEDIVGMVDQEPDWMLHITSNMSLPMEFWQKIVSRKLVTEQRFHINASFHPTQTSIDDFLKRLLFLRSHGIECPVVYVMWPPNLRSFSSYFKRFDSHDFIVHVRRFSGWYDGKYYPRAYTEAERQFIARYADDATIRYMLNEENCRGKLSYAGSQYILVDEDGDVWESPDSKGRCLGNVFMGNVRLYDSPQPYSHRHCASVQGVAALVELGYPELDPNFVVSFSQRGGVYKTKNGVFYGNLNKNFNDTRIRKEYTFPSEVDKISSAFFVNFIDGIYRLLYSRGRYHPLREVTRLFSEFYDYPPGHLTPQHVQSTKKKARERATLTRK
jgi:MoaA/NifB/PqqE/SkfB family radical SAM enzyme